MLEKKIMKELDERIFLEKAGIDEEKENEKHKIDVINKIFYEESDVIQSYMKEENASVKVTYKQLKNILDNLQHELYIEKNIEKFRLKDVNNLLYVRLGYYKIRGDIKKKDLKKYIEQCSLGLTKKGEKVKKEYNTH